MRALRSVWLEHRVSCFAISTIHAYWPVPHALLRDSVLRGQSIAEMTEIACGKLEQALIAMRLDATLPLGQVLPLSEVRSGEVAVNPMAPAAVPSRPTLGL